MALLLTYPIHLEFRLLAAGICKKPLKSRVKRYRRGHSWDVVSTQLKNVLGLTKITLLTFSLNVLKTIFYFVMLVQAEVKVYIRADPGGCKVLQIYS